MGILFAVKAVEFEVTGNVIVDLKLINVF
jgi:hypothetical protein